MRGSRLSELPGSDALDEARAAAEAGDYPRALDRYAWFFDHCLAIDPSFYGVRLSYVIGEWAELGEAYPPARDALVARQIATRDELARAFSRDRFHDLVAISEVLEEPQVAIEAFRRLHDADPRNAAMAFPVAWEMLYGAGEFAMCAAQLPDPMARYRAIVHRHDTASKWDGLAAWAAAQFRGQAGMLLDILRRVGRDAEAATIEAHFREDLASRGLE